MRHGSSSSGRIRRHVSRIARSSTCRSYSGPGDVFVVNDTRVIPARLRGTRTRGLNSAQIEATLIERESDASWRAFARPGKKLKDGDIIRFTASNTAEHLDAEVVSKVGDGEIMLKFALMGEALDRAIERIGHMPLPPYISSRRPSDQRDEQDYQTLFAEKSGAVAAPTASLHFTPRLLAALEGRGVTLQRVTLHVGAGTFLPVKASDTSGHTIHSEWGEVTQATADILNRARAASGRIVAVGTTCLRILESAAARRKDRSVFRPNVDLHYAGV